MCLDSKEGSSLEFRYRLLYQCWWWWLSTWRFWITAGISFDLRLLVFCPKKKKKERKRNKSQNEVLPQITEEHKSYRKCLWCAYNILRYKCLPECVFYWPQSIWKVLHILSLCNNPFSCSFRKSGTALPPLVHQIHVCTSTLTSSFILFGVLGEFSEFRSVRYTCLHLKFAGCSPRLLLLWLPGSGSVNPTAEAEALLTLNIQDLLTCLPTLHPDYRFHGDGEHLLAIFIVTNSSTVLAHSRYSLGAYGNWFHFGCWSFHLPIVVWKEGGMVVGWSWWCVSEGSKGGAKGKENKITWSSL